MAIADRFVGNRVRLIRDATNRGLVVRLNQLVSLASGEYFARMDADDLMHPERLSKQVEFLNSHPNVDLVDSAMYSIDTNGELTGARGTEPGNWTLVSLLRGNAVNHATVLGRTSWFRRYPYDPKYPRAEDLELWCRTIGCSTFARIPEPLYFVREGDVNVPNHLKTKKTIRAIYRRYGRAALGWRETQTLIGIAFAKAVLYRIFGFIGMQRILSSLRNRALSDLERATAEGWLRKAKRQRSPAPHE